MNNKNKDILSNNPSDILTSNITKHNKSNSHPSSYLPCRNNANNSSSSSTTGRNVKVNELKNKPSSSLGTAYCPQHGILPIVKTAYVYQDNDLDNRSSGIRLAIQPNHYRSLEALLEELTTTVSTVTCNEQKMYAPQVMSKFKSMNDIQSNSYYAYSDYPTKSRGISLDRKTTNKANRTIDYKPSSLSTSTSYSRLVLPSYSLTPSKLDLNNLLNRYTTTDTTNSNKFNKTTNCVYLPTLDTLIVDSDETTTWRQLKQVKRIYVRLNGQPRIYKPVLVRRRYIKKLDQVLQELSELFRIPIHKIYTLDGVLVETLRELLDGPSEFVAAGLERFRPIQEIKQPARCLSRSVSRTKNQTRSRSSSALPPIKQTYEQSDKVCDSNVGYTVCQVFIKSGQHDPQTGEMYSSICTANPTITICNKYQSTQPILLKSAYICTINQNNNGNTQPDQGNESSGSDVTSSTLTGPFCPGSVDYFEIPLNDFGEISKIRLSHDGYGNYPEWLPEEICLRLSPGNANQSIDSLKMYSQNNPPSNKLQNSEEEISFSSPTTTSCEMTFPCMRWLSRYKADGSLVREIAAPGTQIRDQGRLFGRILKAYPLDIATLFQQEERSPVMQYQLITKTGNLWNAGVNGVNVNILLQGDRGDTGQRTLWNEEVDRKKAFLRGKTSIFNVEAVFLGRLKALTIWLEPIDTGNDSNSVTTDSGWYLEYVVIHQLSPTFDSVRSQRSVPNNSLLPSSPPTPLPPPSSSPSVTNTDSFLVKTKLSNCKDACGTYLFPCFQWLTTDVGMNSLPIKLIPASGSGALTPDLIESIMSHEKEQIYWQVQKWKFKPDTKIVFYSYLTGAPLQIVHSDRINSQLIHGVAGEKGTQAVFNVCHATFVVSPHPKVSKQHSYSQSRWKNSSDEQGCCTFNRDVDYLSFPPVTVTTNGGNSKHKSSTSSDIRNVKYIRSFTSVKNPWLTMCLDETMGLHMTINSSNSQLSRNLVSQCFDFRIRPQSDRLVALESVKCNSLRSRRTHVYVGPDGRIVSGATGPLTIPGKLFMPYVKGCLRDQTILWMCTGVQQTLIPNLVRETNQKDEEDNISNCKFELRATGERISEAYWRVHKVDKCVRRFESIAWPGHFLRVASDVVDAMGGGGMDCYFKINRVRCKGFIQLSPLVDNNKTIGMNEDGTVTLYKKHTMEENCRFYPEVIKYGYPSCQGQLSSAAVTNKNIDFSPHVTSANNGNFSAEKVEQIQDDSRERLVELTQSQCETAANDNDSVRSTVGDDAEPNDDGMSQSQTSDNQNEQKDMRDSSWKLSIFTEKSAENCRIVLVVYGTGGSSGSILIGRSDDNKGLFQTNRIDNFMIILENIGSIYKIRLEVNPINPDVDTVWEVDKVIIENVTTSKQLSFDFSGRPFGKSANFSCLSREQVTSFIHTNNTISLTEKRQSASEIKLCLTNYRVQLELYHDESNECTPSNISLEPYLCLIGQYGDSGRRLLGEVTCEELVNADRKNVWIFDTLIEAAYLGEMTSCFLGPVDVENQPESKCSGLMCNKILVWDTKKQLIYDFPSENWLLPKTNIQAHEVHLTVGQIHSMEAYAEKRWKEIESGKVNQVDNQFEDVTITETKMSNLLQQSEDSIGKENETVTNERNADVKEFSSEKLLGDLNYATEDELKIIRDARLLVSTIIRKSEANLLVFESQGSATMMTN